MVGKTEEDRKEGGKGRREGGNWKVLGIQSNSWHFGGTNSLLQELKECKEITEIIKQEGERQTSLIKKKKKMN